MSKNKGTLSFGLFIFVIFLAVVLGIFIYFGQKSVFVRLSLEENRSLGEIDEVLAKGVDVQEKNKSAELEEEINAGKHSENENLSENGA